MKITPVQIGQAQSLGRANISAVGGVANAVSSLAGAEKKIYDGIAKVSSEYIERKENAEHTKSKVSSMLQFNEISKDLDAKEYFTAEEASAAPKGSVSLKNPDGTPRNKIPAYEVRPYLLKQRMDEVVKQQAGTISSPMLRDDYLNLANGIVSKENLKSVLKSSEQQRAYLRDVADDSATQLAISGSLEMAKLTLNEGEFSELEIKQRERKLEETFEWENDTRLLNTGNITDIELRYNDLKDENYGKSEGDYLGPGKTSGALNREADLKRFKSTLTGLKGANNNRLFIELKEKIRSAGNGNLGEKNDLFVEGKEMEFIRNVPGLTPNQRNTLLASAPIARAKGTIREQTNLTPLSSDVALIDAGDKLLTSVDASFNDEQEGMNAARKEVYADKIKQLKNDAATFLNIRSPAVGALNKKLNDPDIQKDPERYKSTMKAWLFTMRAEQERIELTPQEVNFLAKGAVDKFKETSESIGRDPLGTSKLVAQMDQLKEIYQHEYPAVYSQLIREGALKPEQVMGNVLKDSAQRIAYIQAIESKADREKTLPYKTNYAAAEKDVFKALSELRGTLLTEGSASNVQLGLTLNQQVNNFSEGLTQMILAEIQAGAVYNPSRASQLVQKVIDSNWVIFDNTRIPINKGYNIENIKKGLGGLSRGGRSIKIDPSIKLFGQDLVGVSPEDSQTFLRERFRKFAVTSTNSDESGVVFKYASGLPVLKQLSNGRIVPLTVSFAELDVYGGQKFVVSNTPLVIK